MNYNHDYHAGNFADVFKHLVLIETIKALTIKDKPLHYIETHAGGGLYNLDSTMAKKTVEAQLGIIKLLSHESSLHTMQSYLSIVNGFINKHERLYPGSPLIAKNFLRPQDRLSLYELHPKAWLKLKNQCKSQSKTKVHHSDGYQGLVAEWPPLERRGLVLIDPPYEQMDEYKQIIKCLSKVYSKFSTGVYTIWYPIKAKSDSERLLNALRLKLPNAKLLNVQFGIAAFSPLSLWQNGLVIVNPPYQLQLNLRSLLIELDNLLQHQAGHGFKLQNFN